MFDGRVFRGLFPVVKAGFEGPTEAQSPTRPLNLRTLRLGPSVPVLAVDREPWPVVGSREKEESVNCQLCQDAVQG